MKLFQAELLLSLSVIFQHSLAVDTKYTKSNFRKSHTGTKQGQRNLILAEDGDGIDGQYIVQLKQNQLSTHSVDTLETTAYKCANSVGATITGTYSSAIHGFVAMGMSRDAAMTLAQDDRVEMVEQDRIVTLADVESWGLDRIDDPDLPLNNRYDPAFGNRGESVTAYIIDTGIMTSHEDFGGRATHGFNIAGGINSDCHGHGTHVAGTVGGTKYGVANKVDLVGVKVLNCQGAGSNAGVIAGINWVMQNARKPATANLSLGSGKSTLVNAAIKKLVDSGVTTVVAAGNSNANACNYSPASEFSAITVGSTTMTDSRSSFSNWGSCVDIFAPGSSITAPWIGGASAINTISGTSMASPHVCGAVALYLGENLSATPSDVTASLVTSSTPGKVTNPGFQSPNRLLFVGSNGDDGDDGSGECFDVPNWYDSDGELYDCEWYAGGNNCDLYGDQFENFDKTANEACCVCGGGLETPQCADTPNWHDSDGIKFDCEWYADKDNCELYGDKYEYSGKTANEACCACKSE